MRRRFNIGSWLALWLAQLAVVTYAQIATNGFKSFTKEGVYRHKKSKTNFPEEINGLRRGSITDFGPGGISVAYHLEDSVEANATVFLYPDKVTNDYDVRTEFLEAMEDMVRNSGSSTTPDKHVVTLPCNSYVVRGLAAKVMKTDSSSSDYLSLFQCGKWALKFRMTSTVQDKDRLTRLQMSILTALYPEELIQRLPFNPESDRMLIDRGTLRDSVMAACALIAGYAESEWARNNVNTMERRAGFPGLYLGGHSAALKIMLVVWQRSAVKGNSATREFMDAIQQIETNG